MLNIKPKKKHILTVKNKIIHMLNKTINASYI